MRLPDSVKDIITAGAYGHVVTLSEDGAPQVSLAWVKVDRDDLLIATLSDQRKLQNLLRDPRVALSFETDELNEWGLRKYVVVHGRAVVEPGGAPELLQDLAHTYLGPDVLFPAMPDPPPGFITRITVERVGGQGPWSSRA